MRLWMTKVDVFFLNVQILVFFILIHWIFKWYPEMFLKIDQGMTIALGIIGIFSFLVYIKVIKFEYKMEPFIRMAKVMYFFLFGSMRYISVFLIFGKPEMDLKNAIPLAITFTAFYIFVAYFLFDIQKKRRTAKEKLAESMAAKKEEPTLTYAVKNVAQQVKTPEKFQAPTPTQEKPQQEKAEEIGAGRNKRG